MPSSSASFPKFVKHGRNLLHELRKPGGTSKYSASAAFRFEVPEQTCRTWCKNFKSAALGSATLPNQQSH
jgi:hypothetical protein